MDFDNGLSCSRIYDDKIRRLTFYELVVDKQAGVQLEFEAIGFFERLNKVCQRA